MVTNRMLRTPREGFKNYGSDIDRPFHGNQEKYVYGIRFLSSNAALYSSACIPSIHLPMVIPRHCWKAAHGGSWQSLHSSGDTEEIGDPKLRRSIPCGNLTAGWTKPTTDVTAFELLRCSFPISLVGREVQDIMWLKQISLSFFKTIC